MLSNRYTHFVIACLVALCVFAAYQGVFGDRHNQAYASLGEESESGRLVNYKPAHKRRIRARLGDDVDALLDLKGHDIAQIFDAPELVRRDLPTTIWQYRSEDCVMDVYFTVARAGDVAKANVAHYELRARDIRAKGDLDAGSCVKGLVARNMQVSLIDIGAVYKASAR